MAAGSHSSEFHCHVLYSGGACRDDIPFPIHHDNLDASFSSVSSVCVRACVRMVFCACVRLRCVRSCACVCACVLCCVCPAAFVRVCGRAWVACGVYEQ